MKPTVAQLMSLNGGYVDTAGFLALQGLFTAHVTGNFVTFGAALVHGTSGAVTKLLALPVFCAVVFVTRLWSFKLPGLGLPVLRTMLVLQLVLLTAAAAFALQFGPFDDGDSWTAVLTGMTLVAAMAIQNAAHRIHLTSAPPTTLMTGTTTQVMIDLSDMFRGLPVEGSDATRARLKKMTASVLVFAAGCALAAVAYTYFRLWCFILPPVIMVATVLQQAWTGEGETS
ncbi:MAG: DUF1275 family protein [Caldimonas sp.]